MLQNLQLFFYNYDLLDLIPILQVDIGIQLKKMWSQNRMKIVCFKKNAWRIVMKFNSFFDLLLLVCQHMLLDLAHHQNSL